MSAMHRFLKSLGTFLNYAAYTLNSGSFLSFSNNWAYANDLRFKIGMGGVIIAMHCQKNKCNFSLHE